MFRKPRQPAPFFKMPGAPFNPFTGERASLGPDVHRGTTLAIFQVIGDDPTSVTRQDTHDNYVVCRGYDPENDPHFRYLHDPYTEADSTPINVAKPFAVRGTFPYQLGQLVVAAKIRTRLGDNQGKASDTTGNPEDLDEAVEILLDDNDVAVSWLDIGTVSTAKRFSVTNGELAQGGSVEVERIKRDSSAWVRSGDTYTAYDLFLNLNESLEAGTIVSTIRYDGVDVIDAMYCAANDWLEEAG